MKTDTQKPLYRDKKYNSFSGKVLDFIEDFMGNHPLFTIGAATLIPTLIIATPISFGIYSYAKRQETYHNELRNKVEMIADTNNDSIVSREEMRDVYRSLDLRLNEVNPRELTVSEMEKFLQIHKN
ncbi:hypothetical protein HYV49_00875 [Candidatus Pacearchaeota archaeon]|nr:hypothetical protein [Candidatus Pacearchaeota archaeon]